MVFTKWGGGAHWEYDAQRLGRDDQGTWLGVPLGTSLSRPGAAFETSELQVVLVPDEDPFVATFYRRGELTPCEVYVDITTPPQWSGSAVAVVDLDLDVVRGWTGRVWVDDEDEFAEHRVSLGYPEEVARMADEACEEVRRRLESSRAPYDGTAERWFSLLEAGITR